MSVSVSVQARSLVSLDLGFLFVKAIVDGSPIRCKSVVGNGKNLRFEDMRISSMSCEDRLSVVMDGNNYFVSDLAIKQSDSVSNSLNPNRFNSKAVKALYQTVLGLGLGSGTHEVYVVSGLPVSHYSKFKSELREMILSVSDYHVRNDAVQIGGSLNVVGCKFIPQPFGIYLDHVLDSRGIIEKKQFASGTVGVIDIGFGTTDIYVVNALEPVESLTFSTDTAMSHAYSLISDRLEEMYGTCLPLYKIESVVDSGFFELKGVRHDFSKIISWAFELTANQLLSEISNKWKRSWEIDNILIGGGGGFRLYDYLRLEIPSCQLVSDPQFSVARGYEKWGKRHFAEVALNGKK